MHEINQLKACVNDLVSLLALPAMWTGGEPRRIISALLDVLLGVLHLDFAYARWKSSSGGVPAEIVRLPRHRGASVRPGQIGEALKPWLMDGPRPSPLVIRNPTGDGDVSLAPLRLGLQEELGWVVMGARRAGFPTQTERLLLTVAVNQAALGLQEARLLSDQRRVAVELDQKVAQRTEELSAANDQLQKEIFERTSANEKLRRSEALLAEAQRVSHTGTIAWNLASGEIFWSEETFRIFGFELGTKPTLELLLQRVHPEDIGFVQQTLGHIAREGSDLDLEYRLHMPEGSVKHVHVVGRSLKEPSGRLEFVGAVSDVTSAKLAYRQVEDLKDQLQRENVVLREEVDTTSMFEEIVGASPALRKVLSSVSKVGPTESTVLITGETGTGKELVVRAIHKRSPRARQAFVSVNCAAIPASLVASELFGHEKGAFTGALQRRLGRFELAQGGTLFLDEVGELSTDIQVALLRVLQEHTFERVGGTQAIRADVRLLAATNRDLRAAIDGGFIRSDLFYRLNVFPIEMPSLRARAEDVPVLTEYFVHRYAAKLGKKISSIDKRTLDLFRSYPWPGNIRELQNIIERSLILCETETFSVDESWLAREPARAEAVGEPLHETLAAGEKAIIEGALAESKGRVSRPFGAAVKLGMPASTLESKIRALKIHKRLFKAES